MSDIFSGGTFFVGYRVCDSQHVLKKYIWRRSIAHAKNVMFTLNLKVLAKVSTFTDGFVLEGGITNCRVNQ